MKLLNSPSIFGDMSADLCQLPYHVHLKALNTLVYPLVMDAGVQTTITKFPFINLWPKLLCNKT